jgi:hypothetical protein
MPSFGETRRIDNFLNANNVSNCPAIKLRKILIYHFFLFKNLVTVIVALTEVNLKL